MQDYRHTINVVGWVFATLSTTMTVARVYTRVKLSKATLGLDDWFMVAASVLCVTGTILVTIGTTHGYGMHINDIKNPNDQADAAMYVMISPQPILASGWCTKASIIFAFVRIMGTMVKRRHKLIFYIPLAGLAVAYTLSFIVMIFFCWPVQKTWRPYLEGHCMSPKMLDVVGRSTSMYNAGMDVFCAIVPYFLIRSLALRFKEKLNLILLMSASIFGVIATIFKVVAMSTISNVADVTYSWATITIWYLAECNVLIMAGSLPALRPFWRVLYGKYSNYHSSAYDSRPGRKYVPKASAPGSHALQTIGSTPLDAHRGQHPGPYSIALRGDSSDESLGAARPNNGNGADSESVVGILPKPESLWEGAGPHRAKTSIERGDGCSSPDVGRSDWKKITVTREVEVV